MTQKPEINKEVDLSRRMNRNLVESAVIPNSIEMNAIRTEGLGKYNSKEFVFVRRFRDSASSSKKLITSIRC